MCLNLLIVIYVSVLYSLFVLFYKADINLA